MTNELDSTCGVSDEEMTERFKEAIRIDTIMIREGPIQSFRMEGGNMQTEEKKPEIIVFAGPNGSGKSTITRLARVIDYKRKHESYGIDSKN